MEKKSLLPEQARAICDRQWLDFNTTADVPPIEGIIGQERAAKAIEFGLQIEQEGYNIYVSGIPGSGRTTSIEAAVKEIAKKGRRRMIGAMFIILKSPIIRNILDSLLERQKYSKMIWKHLWKN